MKNLILAVAAKRGLQASSAEFGRAFLTPRSRASGRSHREDRLQRGIRADDAALVQALRSRTLPNVRPKKNHL